MNPSENKNKKRKIIREGSFLQQRYYILQTLGYYNEQNTAKLRLREALETRFKEIVPPAAHGPPSMNILEVPAYDICNVNVMNAFLRHPVSLNRFLFTILLISSRMIA